MSTPLKRFDGPDRWDAIVVGSGIGGLATAALLARRGGRRVLVLERHYTAGGFTHAFRRPGYDWDVGVHYLGNVAPGSMVRRLFDDIGDGSLEWADMGPVYDRIRIGDDVYDYPKGRSELAASLKASFPAETAAIDRYFELVRAATRAGGRFYAEKVLPRWLAGLAGGWMRRGFLALASRTTRSVLEELTRNQRLIAVLSAQFGDYGTPPGESSFAAHATVTSHYFRGGYYPVGGAGRIAESIIPTITDAGGAVLTSAPVGRIVTESGRAVGVEMETGRRFTAPIVVSDAGVRTTVERLLPAGLSGTRRLTDDLATVRPSCGHFSLYLGAEGTPEELGLPKANWWLFPHERLDEAVAESRRNPAAPFPVVYLSFPAAKDPDFQRRHPGHSSIEAITLAPWEWMSRWDGSAWRRRPAGYEAFKREIADRLQEIVVAQVPGLAGKIRHAELSTPLTTAHFAGYRNGEIYGIDHTPARFQARFLRPRTPVAGLYLTGQDISTCGVAGALVAGYLTASALLGRNLLAAR